MMGPVCVSCAVEMRCHRNGQAVLTLGGLWHGDQWRCPECGGEVIVGFGQEPVCVRADPSFRAVLASEAYFGPVVTLKEV